MKTTRKKAVDLYNTLSTFKGVYNKTFSMYLVLNNKKLIPIMQEVQDIQSSTQPTPEYLELQKKELAIVNKYAVKDENDKLVIVANGGFQIQIDKVNEYKEEKECLINNNKTIIDEYEELKSNIEKLMSEEIECDLILIPFETIPDEIGVKDLETLSEIVEDFGKIKK